MWKAVERTERAGGFPLEGGIFPVGRYWMAAVLGRSSLPDSARAVLRATQDRLRQTEQRDAYAMHEAYVRLMIGEREASLALLDTAIRRDPAKRRMSVLGYVKQADHQGLIEMVDIFEDPSFGSDGPYPYWWGWFNWPWWWHHSNGVGRITWTVPLEPSKPVDLGYEWNHYWH